MKPKLLVSVSGGRTSALMAYLLFTRYQHEYEMIFVFANTSREKEETLIFVNQLSVIFGMPIIWVEAVVHAGRKGTTHKIVTFETACRDGSVFEDVIKKYGIPNKVYLHCTRELKAQPIASYAKSVGFKGCLMAIGYRKDEPKRVNLLKAEEKKQWYPLFDWGIKKSDVANFWLKQSFDLKLEDWEGNCKLCHKKSKRKLLTQIVADPESTLWVIDMENRYRHFKKPTRNNETIKNGTCFFRNSEGIYDLITESKMPFERAVDQSLLTDGAAYDFELDEQEGCSESCEPF